MNIGTRCSCDFTVLHKAFQGERKSSKVIALQKELSVFCKMQTGKLLLWCFILLCFETSCSHQTDKMKLVWSDEFNYSGLPDSGRWDYEVGGNGFGNNEL